MNSELTQNQIKASLQACRNAFGAVLFFGLFVNALMLAVSIYSMQVYDRVLSSGSIEALALLTAVVSMAILFMATFQWLRALILAHVAHWFEARLAEQVAAGALDLALIKPAVGAQPLRDLATMKAFLSSSALNYAFDAPWAAIYFVVIFVINVTLGWVVLGAALILTLLSIASETMPKRQLTRAQESHILSLQAIEGVLRNAEVISAMGFQASALRVWREHMAAGAREAFQAGHFSNILAVVIRNMRLFIQTALTGIAAWLVIRGDMSSGGIIGASMLAGKALAPFDTMLPVYQGSLGAKKAYDRLVEVRRLSTAIGQPKVRLPDPTGQVSIEKLTYQDPTSGRWILRGINVDFAAGEAIGIIGASGSGKTTLARILTGVLKPTSGCVRIDGAALEQWDREHLGQFLGYLPQDVELFDGTVAENIARLDPDRPAQDMVAAAHLGHVHEYILQLPNGYQTNVGRNGSALSAGQRQRVALARCFVGNVKVVVLDEPNSNLDRDGEQALVHSLLMAKERGITTISIVHRPAVLQKVGKVLVLHNGEAKMFGPAREILERLTQSTTNVSPLRRVRGGDDDLG